MRRLPFRTLAVIALVAFSVALYREWVERNKPPLFLPLGFFEQALSVVTPEENSQNPLNWEDPIKPNVLDAADFDALARSANMQETNVDVLVAGATLGGTAAALAAAEEGLSVAMVTAKDWRTELLAEAGEFSAERLLSDAYGSPIERELRTALRISTISSEGRTNGLPSDVATFFADLISKTANVRILSPYALVAFGRDGDGRIARALLQSPDGSTSLVTRFDYVIDGTNDGSIIARAGVVSRSSWTEADAENEPETPSADALNALAEGYSMSGRTIPGIGKRLEGAKMYIGVRDRGYNGWFVAPTTTDPCWQAAKNDVKPFVQNARILRANAFDCVATMRFDADFEDSMEIFWINHGNDSVQATVWAGSGHSIRIYKQFDPATKFVQLGTFPVTPAYPLSIDISSVLPVDKLEGLIVRKANTSGRAASIDASESGGSKTFETGGWDLTFHDVYVSMDDEAGLETGMLDGAVIRAEAAGAGTYVFRNVPLRPGTHSLELPVGITTAGSLAIPTSPARENISLSGPLSRPAKRGYTAWTFVAQRDGRVLFAAPAGACDGQCYAYATQSGSTTNEAEAFLTDGMELIATSYPMFTMDVKKGASYVVSADQGYDATRKPLASFVGSGAELYSSGGGKLRVAPTRQGDAYDVWMRTRWSSETEVSTPSGEWKLGGAEGWQYVSTEILDTSGVTVNGTGFTEILAVPNILVETYRIPLSPDTPSTIEKMPHGSYSMTSFGVDEPERMQFTDVTDGRVSIVEFEGDNGVYASRSPFVHGKGPFTVSLANNWPQMLVMHERLEDKDLAKTTFGSGALLLVLDGKAMDIAHPGAYSDRANNSAGAFLFTPRAKGIGPVTIGTMDSETEAERMRRYANDAYLLLRFGRTNLTKPLAACSITNDPSCDPRRYIRDPLVFGTTDAMAPVPVYPEGRRLKGRETLGYIDAHAVLRTCVYCSVECIGEATDARCVRGNTSAWNTSGIVSFPGTEAPPAVTSPLENHLKTLPALFQSMRRDGLIGPESTYFEGPSLPRDITLTLGMIVAADEPNVLSANASISATHGGAAALRTPTAELLIGSAAGYSVGFATKYEHASLAFIADSEPATRRLQQYLIDRGMNVIPMGKIDDDPLLVKAIQWRVLEGRASLEPSWIDGRLTYVPRLPEGENMASLERLAFGEKPAKSMRDALRWLDGSDAPINDVSLLRLGIQNGYVNDKMLNLSVEEILGQSLNEDLLLKAEYLLHSR